MFSSFLSFFGLFCLIGCIVLFIMIKRLEKKQLPTEQERQALVKLGLLQVGETNKKVLREKTTAYRTYMQVISYLGSKAVEEAAQEPSEIVEVEIKDEEPTETK